MLNLMQVRDTPTEHNRRGNLPILPDWADALGY